MPIPRQTVMLWLVTFCYWLALWLPVPLLTPYVVHLGGSMAQAGVAAGGAALTQLVLRVPLAMAAERRRKPVMVLGLAAALASALILLWVPGVPGVVGSRLTAGVGSAAWTAFLVRAAGAGPSSQALRAVGAIDFARGLGQLAAGGVEGWLVAGGGWADPYRLSAAAAGIGLALVMAVTEVGSGGRRRRGAAPRSPSPLTRLAGPLVLTIVVQAVIFSTVFGFLPERALQLGASRETAAWVVGVALAANTLAAWTGPRWLAGGYALRRVIRFGLLLTALGTASLGWGGGADLPLLYLSQAVNGFGQGLVVSSLLAWVVVDARGGFGATQAGIFQALYSVGSVAGPLLTGLLAARWGLVACFEGWAGLVLLSAWAAPIFLPTPAAGAHASSA